MAVSDKRDLKYARALDALDASRDAGQVSSNEYDVRRAKLIKEAAKQPWHWGIQLAVLLGILIGFLIVLRIAGAFVNAVSS